MSQRRIDDHSFWAGGKSKGSMMPEGVKIKEYDSAEGVGRIGDYVDTSEGIKRLQEENNRKARSHSQPSNHKN